MIKWREYELSKPSFFANLGFLSVLDWNFQRMEASQDIILLGTQEMTASNESSNVERCENKRVFPINQNYRHMRTHLYPNSLAGTNHTVETDATETINNRPLCVAYDNISEISSDNLHQRHGG